MCHHVFERHPPLGRRFESPGPRSRAATFQHAMFPIGRITEPVFQTVSEDFLKTWRILLHWVGSDYAFFIHYLSKTYPDSATYPLDTLQTDEAMNQNFTNSSRMIVKETLRTFAWAYTLVIACASEPGTPYENAPTSSAITVAWSTAIAGGDASVAILNDRLVVASIDFAADGTDAHRITCFNRIGGNILWEQVYAERSFVSQDISDRFPVRPLAKPIIVGDLVIVCGFGGSVRCLSLADGTQSWSMDLVQEHGANPIQYGYACSPWSDGKQVVVACGGEQALLLSLDAAKGTVLWKCGTGVASYTSPISFPMAESNFGDVSAVANHLVYAAGDEVIGVNPNSGKILWQYSYPKRGLTNAVTPIAVANGKLLVGGQGVEGTRLLSIAKDAERFVVTEDWHNSKTTPFYCNWIQMPSNSKCVMGFIGKTLTALDWIDGNILWQKRNWTDCNLLGVGKQVIIVRGDGLVGLLNANEKGFELIAGDDTYQDRVWATPVLFDGHLYLIGRSRLACIPIRQLKSMTNFSPGTEVTSMDAMYGNRPERIRKLIDLAAQDGKFPFADYLSVASDRTLQLGEGDYRSIFDNLSKRNAIQVALEIATDWTQRSPHSIPARERFIELLRKAGKGDMADAEIRERMVDVTIELNAPEVDPKPGRIYVTGNASSLGPWNASAIELKLDGDGKYRATCKLPLGDFQFKFTCGSMERVEVRNDGRSTSNRRHRITAPTTITSAVQAWKK